MSGGNNSQNNNGQQTSAPFGNAGMKIVRLTGNKNFKHLNYFLKQEMVGYFFK